jgi:solute carrier family 25 citrate transporter 1
VKQNGIGSLYTGGAAFCVSNAAKSGIRFLSFDTIRNLFPKDANGKIPVIGTLTAGLAAGVAESFAVLTPGETIKTKMIQDRAGARVFRSTGHAVESILATEGPLGFYRGVWPVAMKQSANAMVRFTSYSILLEKLKPILSKQGLPTSAIAGSLAGAITVYCTMPFDSVKTQLQSVEGKQMYKGTWDCVRKLVASGGVRSLWKGTTPRLVRLSVSPNLISCWSFRVLTPISRCPVRFRLAYMMLWFCGQLRCRLL